MVVGDRRLGALNLYSRTEDHFGDDDQRAARAFADQAAVVLSNATAFATAEMVNVHLTEALATRDIIGMAKGVLIAGNGYSPDEAFDLLRQASQRTNRKLRDVALGVIQAKRPGSGTAR